MKSMMKILFVVMVLSLLFSFSTAEAKKEVSKQIRNIPILTLPSAPRPRSVELPAPFQVWDKGTSLAVDFICPAGSVDVEIADAAGNVKIRMSVDSDVESSVDVDVSFLSEGVYTIRLVVPGFFGREYRGEFEIKNLI